MEKTPYQPHLDAAPVAIAPPAIASDWRAELPLLASAQVTLRDLRPADAAPLLALLSTEEVSRFISPPPATVEGFDRFIRWTHRQRAAGQYACFAVVPYGSEAAVGLFQVRSLEPGFGTAEWGFALGRAYWGRGLFVEAARLVLDFTFQVIGAHRVEARAAVRNSRGSAALRKIGAVQEGVLRRSFLRNGEFLDQALWSILEEDWHDAKSGWLHDVIH
jgi:ribosomal-protein-alanine N-acetyltransferase